ncbi:tail protein X [Uliginosibacterium paludis]|uniref:Tail protein X n=1 Tax=Uliginosibacterium paludis TaxID=1615952 RepID=A0ABV2CUL1_9RHOO
MATLLNTVRSRQGDTLDALCWRYYGATQGHVEAVLEANPGLAELGAVLPMDTEVRMPAASARRNTASTTETLNLWD